MEQYIRIIADGETEQKFSFQSGQTVKDVLTENKIAYDFACGGQGRCGKCKIRVIEGNFSVSVQDKEFFSEEQLQKGYRLACTAVLTGPALIQLAGSQEQRFEALSGYQTVVNADLKSAEQEKLLGYGIAIDIGTTTIAMNLLERKSGQSKAAHTLLNRQRLFGADVITRIQAANEGKGEQLRQSVQEDLLEGLNAVLSKGGILSNELEEISIAGNTTMLHLLLGYSCESLGVYPFEPVDISAKTLTFAETFGTACMEKCSINAQTPVYFVPGITTFVGADITAGLLNCGFAQSDEVCMLIDLGTNGEMAIGNKERLLVTSTAAGPAFEGGNISCGTGSIEGAVCDLRISDGKTEIATIGDRPIVGICGTGVIAVTAGLLEEEKIEPSGLLDEDYFEEGFLLGTKENGEKVVFTQKDVRELQLAKAAVRAGAETLILRYGISKKQISKLYLAGGFGYKMNVEKAAAIGLIPQELTERVEAVGNSSLGGAALALCGNRNKEKLVKIVDAAQEISLSEDRDFQEFYVEYMMFEEE